MISAETKKKIKRYISLIRRREKFYTDRAWIFETLKAICQREGVQEIGIVGTVRNQVVSYSYNASDKSFGEIYPSDLSKAKTQWEQICAKYSEVDFPHFKKNIAADLHNFCRNHAQRKIVTEESQLSDQIEQEIVSHLFSIHGQDMHGKSFVFNYEEKGERVASFIFSYSFQRHNMGWKQINKRRERTVFFETV